MRVLSQWSHPGCITQQWAVTAHMMWSTEETPWRSSVSTGDSQVSILCLTCTKSLDTQKERSVQHERHCLYKWCRHRSHSSELQERWDPLITSLKPRALYRQWSGSLSQLLLQRGYTYMNFGQSSLLRKSFTDSNNIAFVHNSLVFLFGSCLRALCAKFLKLQPMKMDLISNNQGIDKSL